VNPPLSPMSSLSDGQRYALKHRLGEFAGSSVRLILVGNNPQPGILFEQLADIFKDAGWNVQTMQAGMVSAVGENFPHFPYLTGPNISAPAVRNVFSIFAAVGIDLPLTPDWWDEAGMLSFVPTSRSYCVEQSSHEEIWEVSIGDVGAPCFGTPSFAMAETEKVLHENE